MEILFDNEAVANWLVQYGSLSLFLLLVLGILILPVPEETLMVFAGILMGKGSLSIPFTLLAAYSGSICGITLSHLLGRTAGKYLIHKYGTRIGITDTQLNQVHNWFERFGKWTLMIGYFIPGVRHFTGFISGTAYMDVKQFMWFAYSGAVIWVSIFLSLGYFSSDFFFSVLETVQINADKKIAIFIVTAAIVGLLYSKLRKVAYFQSK